MLPTLRLASRLPSPWRGNGPLSPEEAARHSLSSANELRCRQLLEATTARYRHREASAAVLVPLCSVHGDPSLLYTLRSSHLIGRHKGVVSFPGGKCDPQDQDIVDTALRETREELGLPIQEENVWGVMKPVNDRKNSVIVPVIAQVGPLESLDLTPNPKESRRDRASWGIQYWWGLFILPSQPQAAFHTNKMKPEVPSLHEKGLLWEVGKAVSQKG
ncbi:nucleoside diphosphate-linked moiety X motif 8-like isoform X2 [Dromiciops gliroides]|uniref:nucleoside diphosphate-linked moiety X motif 8-like isoform X2 n=1 Tax=Dromiciops gliroides TaxID=33562 RepID=UPI001CC46213|nr:nucleoside diphosphate-linked moiety X motif 8-like isoform X2 [Dromiciops gliroides]